MRGYSDLLPPVAFLWAVGLLGEGDWELHWALLPLLQVGQFMFVEGVRVRLPAGGQGEVVDLNEEHVGGSSQGCPNHGAGDGDPPPIIASSVGGKK